MGSRSFKSLRCKDELLGQYYDYEKSRFYYKETEINMTGISGAECGEFEIGAIKY
jgi:hypothetical protein